MNTKLCISKLPILIIAIVTAGSAWGLERTEDFDADPGWDGHNNIILDIRSVTQNFGYSPNTNRAGRAKGEIGGYVFPAGEPAYYSKQIEPLTLVDSLAASGTLTVAVGEGHSIVGFFNSRTTNEWRTANSLAMRIYGRGSYFHAYVEYGTSRWRAGGAGFPVGGDDKHFTSGVPHTWSLTYNPANGGTITLTLDSDSRTLKMDSGHQADGATFDRFGIVNVIKSYDGAGSLWLDNVMINGVLHTFDADPKWEEKDNRRTYNTTIVRPRFNFGYRTSQYAGGQGAGEMGGQMFRGDCRSAAGMAYYGDPLSPLTLENPLHASGKVAFRQGVSDSTTLIGFFNSIESVTVYPTQDKIIPHDFMGAAIEGPSSEGFFFYPTYSTQNGLWNFAEREAPPLPPYIYPDGVPRDWSMDYDPLANGGLGRMTVALGGQSIALDLNPGHRTDGAHFDRFGLVTTWRDGNGQQVYFDDLTYTTSRWTSAIPSDAWLYY